MTFKTGLLNSLEWLWTLSCAASRAVMKKLQWDITVFHDLMRTTKCVQSHPSLRYSWYSSNVTEISRNTCGDKHFPCLFLVHATGHGSMGKWLPKKKNSCHPWPCKRGNDIPKCTLYSKLALTFNVFPVIRCCPEVWSQQNWVNLNHSVRTRIQEAVSSKNQESHTEEI